MTMIEFVIHKRNGKRLASAVSFSLEDDIGMIFSSVIWCSAAGGVKTALHIKILALYTLYMYLHEAIAVSSTRDSNNKFDTRILEKMHMMYQKQQEGSPSASIFLSNSAARSANKDQIYNKKVYCLIFFGILQY